MGVGYQAVLWNPQKKRYDLALLLGIVLYLGTFIGLGAALYPQTTAETLIIRGCGTLALLLLHVVLSIGPLCRLDARFLPLLYNRRHLGVATFLVGAVHGGFSLMQFHAFGDTHPLVSLLAGNSAYGSLSEFPFQVLGFTALGILFLMAATSHDFWLANLSAPVWKTLHMLVYVAYGLLVVHVALGVLQAETNSVYSSILGVGMTWIFAIHLIAGFREARGDREPERSPAADGWIAACRVDEIAPNKARIIPVGGERVAVFKYDGKISAVSNVCQHQNGPLGEGRVVDGCITCPWHGYQYEPDTGASPPPFTEKVPTFNVRIDRDQVWIDPKPNAPGTRVEPVKIGGNRG